MTGSYSVGQGSGLPLTVTSVAAKRSFGMEVPKRSLGTSDLSLAYYHVVPKRSLGTSSCRLPTKADATHAAKQRVDSAKPSGANCRQRQHGQRFDRLIIDGHCARREPRAA